MSQQKAAAIPMVDLTAQYPLLRADIEAGLQAALSEARFILGPNVQALEEEIATYLGVEHCVSVASGTDALHLALRAAGVGEGDEVITTPFSFISTAEAICYVGARPVFADIDPRTFNVDPAAVEAAITPATRAIMPVHLFGQPANMPVLRDIAGRHDLMLIEDCAQSFGAAVNESMTGSLGHAGAFSFFPSKNLGGYGDGGLIGTNDDKLAVEARMLRNHGSRQRYYHDEVGYNSRLDELQAVILRAKLPHIDDFNQQRRSVAARYTDALQGVTGLTIPHEDGVGRHVYHQYTLLCEDQAHRDRLMAALAADNIASAVYYPVPLHQQAAFSDLHDGSAVPALPVAEDTAKRCLSLPIYPELALTDVDRIAAVLRR